MEILRWAGGAACPIQFSLDLSSLLASVLVVWTGEVGTVLGMLFFSIAAASECVCVEELDSRTLGCQVVGGGQGGVSAYVMPMTLALSWRRVSSSPRLILLHAVKKRWPTP